MKHTEEFKYQDQLDATSQLPKRRVSKGGTLMIVFFVGVIMAAAVPVGFKLLTNSMLMSMAAHKPVAKVKATESIEVATPKVKAAKKEAAAVKKVAKADAAAVAKVEAVAAPKEAASAKKVTDLASSKKTTVSAKKAADVKALEKIAAKAKERKAVKAPKVEKVAKAESLTELKPSPKTRAVESVMEIAQGPNAAVIQEKADEEFLSTANAVTVDADYRTIYNASYNKNELTNCKQRCVLQLQDAKGQIQSAIINGPEFAAILAGHKGTINVTGKKRLLKNHSVFMVQNITFNLAPGKTKQAESPKARIPGQQAKAAAAEDDNYEDLSLDLSN